MNYKLEKLQNGITLLKVPISESRSVVVNFFVKTGSRNEIAAKRGMSHFLEHLLFKGTKKYPNAKILATTLETIGAEYNAFTNKEYTGFYIKAASEHLSLIFDVLSEMLQNPLLDKAEIAREKNVIFEEMRMYEDTPIRYVHDLLEEQMWPRSDLGEKIIGTPQTVSNIGQEDLHNYILSNYTNSNLILGIAGNFSSAELFRLVKKYWSVSRQNQPTISTPAPRPNPRLNIKLHYKKTEQAHLALGFYGLSYNHPERFTASVFANLLGGGMSSRLFSEIRERRGLAYYVRMSSDHYQDTGAMVISAGLRLKSLKEALAVLSAELLKIKSTAIPLSELSKAKKNLQGRIILSLEDAENRLEWYLQQAAFHKSILTAEQVNKKIGAVTGRQVRNFAKSFLRRERANLAVIGPYRGQEKLVAQTLKF